MNDTRWTVAPLFYCDIAARQERGPICRAELRGGVAFCRFCQGTAATHRQVLMMDDRPIGLMG